MEVRILDFEILVLDAQKSGCVVQTHFEYVRIESVRSRVVL